ncbi:GTP cyclohydrolase II RibA [Imbroritus primus]|uniref:GTP cyclohydrolase II RibA n=1 Tax=Imbroritus primus TaxID=3058603 RepID=A0ACD3SNA6_9BURK|nr:GTP cyclohydrolase II RibA [Burkholderiaceae bacterium PBA]
MQQAERGVFDLRRGQPVLLTAEEDAAGAARPALLVAAVEALRRDTRAALEADAGTPAVLLLTAQRAAMLGLQPPSGLGSIAITLPADMPFDALLALAGAVHAPLPGNTATLPVRLATAQEDAALVLAKAGRILPALLASEVPATRPAALQAKLDDQSILTVGALSARRMSAASALDLKLISEAPVPLADAENARFMLFREPNGLLEHVAVVIGDHQDWSGIVPVRLHSACLTGDLFGSLRCDCGEQLRNSVRDIAADGGGVLLYLAQEGRGIGLANKLRAYTLQDTGLDTIDADRTLGFRDDERRYEAAVAMLRAIGISHVQLHTNNPTKIRALEQAGIQVAVRKPVLTKPHAYNQRYLNTKAERAGHMLEPALQPADEDV